MMSDKNVIRCLFTLVLLNIIDTYVTATLVPAKIAQEINPIMNFVLNYGVLPFILVKLAAISLVCYVFWKFRSHSLAKIGILVSLFAYIWLISYFLVEIL